MSGLLATSLASALAAGCYAPTPPAGAYSCTAADPACPSGQHCTCDQCVSDDSQAACGFGVSPTTPACADWPATGEGAAPAGCVHEHEAFPVLVTAYLADQRTVATGFAGGLSVTSSWGDAEIVPGSTVAFVGGKATVQVRLNRETVGAAGARLTFHAGSATGTSGHVAVVPPKWTVDAQQALLPSGWANAAVNEAAVVRLAPDQYRMYFAGAGLQGITGTLGIGVATSTDGLSWATQPAPLLTTPQGDWAKKGLDAPAPFRGSGGDWRMIFKGDDAKKDALGMDTAADGPSQLGLAISGDGLGDWKVQGSAPVIKSAGCGFCTASGLDFPSVVASPGAPAGSLELYFSTTRSQMIDVSGMKVPFDLPLIGHAESADDGATWDVDPTSVFGGSLGGDEIVLAPRVIVDGSVYKMFYAYANDLTTVNPCDPGFHLSIGYATSADGLFWVRSPSNPVIDGDVPWTPASLAFLPGAPLFVDDSDPSKGIELFFSPFVNLDLGLLGKVCVPSGIGRAVRP